MKLSEIEYKRPEFEQFKSEFQDLLDELKSSTNFSDFESVLKKINEKRELFESFQSLCHIRHSIDTKDTFYDEENSYFDQVSPVFAQISNELNKILAETEFKNDINSKYGAHFLNGIETALKTFDAKIIEDLTKENELASEYDKLIASATVQWEGKELTMSQLSPFATDKNRDTRKKASDTANTWFAAQSEKIDQIYHDLVQVRTKIAKDLGYENFVQLAYYRLGRTDYGAQEVAAFRDAVHRHIVPVVNELRERQAKRIGVEKLEYYDIGFQFESGNPKPKGDPQYIVDAGEKMYKELSKETDEFFQFMLKNELMDLESKTGKMAGGYCTYMPSFKSPFIFSNFNGTSHDIDVLTHEAGHAFQVYSSREQPIPEYYWPTLEACEIHSMSMEFLTWPWMESFFKEDTAKYRFSHLSAGLLFLPYGVAIDEFQHYVYENPTVSPETRNAKWLEIEAKYMPYKANPSSEFLQTGRMWHKQGHLFRVPFYYIDYTLAQVCAYQFWKASQDDFQAAWDKYLKLCQLGGSDSFTGLLSKSDLQNPFEESTLKDVASWVKEYVATVDDSKF